MTIGCVNEPTVSTAGLDWAERPDECQPECETDERGWPILHPACPELNPTNRHVCVLGDHHGCHCDDTGAEWLDNGL